LQFQNTLTMLGYLKVWGFALQDYMIEHNISCRSLSVYALSCFLIVS